MSNYPKITEFSKILPSEVSVQNPSPKKSKAIPITLGILKSDLTPNQKIITGLLSFKCGPRLHCELPINDLTKILGISKRHVYDNLKGLQDQGIILKQINRGVNIYSFLYKREIYKDYFLETEKGCLSFKEGKSFIPFKLFKRIYLSLNILKEKELYQNEKLCLGVLYTKSRNKETAIVDGGQKELADMLNIKERGLTYLLKKLKEKEFIQLDREGNVVTYTFLDKFTSLIKGENMANSEIDLKKFVDFYKDEFYLAGPGIPFHESFLKKGLSLGEALALGALMKKIVDMDKENKIEADGSFPYIQSDQAKDYNINLKLINDFIKKVTKKKYVKVIKKNAQTYYKLNLNKLYPIILEDE